MRRITLWARCRFFGGLLTVGVSSVLALAVAQPGYAQVLVVLYDAWPAAWPAAIHPHLTMVAEFQKQLEGMRDGHLRIDVVRHRSLADVDDASMARTELVVAVGFPASGAAFERTRRLTKPPPILCLGVSRGYYESLAGTTGSSSSVRSSAVYGHQPAERLLDLVLRALPERKRVGVVLGPSSKSGGSGPRLGEAARARALVLRVAYTEASSDVYAALQEVLPGSDVLLALPDFKAIDASNAIGLLRASAAERVPVVAGSRDMVRAGSLLGLYSDELQLGKHGGEIARQFLTGPGTLPLPQYPKYFTVRVNTAVARSLGLQIDSEAALAASLHALERDNQRAASASESSTPRKAN